MIKELWTFEEDKRIAVRLAYEGKPNSALQNRPT
ncbi:hypothetical protein CAP48_02970 [Advenella sp. S44]|nr:hypothetical protein CAP48_02970 [Advenella sp. S44]